MNAIVPGGKSFALRRGKNRDLVKHWTKPDLDWKVKVVCESCNNGWMADIENDHAKPAMSDLIAGKLDFPVDQKRANSIALFAFKSAVVIDHTAVDREPFFDKSVRYEFRESLTIPTNIGMWLTGFALSGSGEVSTLYHKGRTAPENGIEVEMYVLSYFVEHLVLQVVAHNNPNVRSIFTKHDFSPVPFWPEIADGFNWPPQNVLHSASDFHAFSDRWNDVFVRL